MNASFITFGHSSFDPKGQIPPAFYIRRSFQTDKDLVSAVLKMTALGQYIPYINGERPDNSFLNPGYTEYSVRLQVQTYDVTGLMKEGENVLAAVVGDGWWRGSCGPMGMRATYGTALALCAELTLTYENRTEVIVTDPSWKWTDDGPVRAQDIKLLEEYDARKEMPGWNCPGYDDSAWHTAKKTSYEGELIPQEGEKVLAHEHFTPKVLHTPDGSTVLDFGQNMAGIVSFSVTGKAGQTCRLLHGEALDQNGNFTTSNLGDGKIMKLGQELVYALKDGTQTYAPQFLICGFRYAKVLDWPEEVKAENFEAIAVYSDVKMTGAFTCSNEKINRLVKNIEWSLKSNFVDIPTDCPQRERAGWSGDINVFIECANLLCDTRTFISKWLKDLASTCTAEGAPLAIVPKVYMMNRKSNETTPGAAGWADAITQIPMRQYLVYGETEDLALCYESMKKYVDFNVSRAKKASLRSRLKGGADPYILDTGFHYGEWLEPGAANMLDALKAYMAPDAEVATAWFFYSAKTLAEAAKILGKEDDFKKYAALAKEIQKAYCKRFIPGGHISSGRQCRYVRPLYMGLVNDDTAKAVAAQLNDLIVKNNYHIGTGFLSTYQVLNVLSDNGYHETACRMLENEECPGWLYEVDCGATTIWEGWDAVDPKTGKLKAKSLNHYSPGAALSWLWTRLCGIRSLAPGYQKIEIRPLPGGSLTSACAAYESPAGRIVSDWRIEEGRFILNAVIPDGIPASVILPDGTVYENAVTGEYSCPYRS